MLLGYQLRIAAKSLRRNPGNTAIVAGGIALGVAVTTLFATVRHTFAKDPIPSKSDVLHYVRMDSWNPDEPYPGNRPPPQITYRDMKELLRSDIPIRQAGMFKSYPYIFPDPSVGRPRREMVRLTHNDFFAMFEVPFTYGGPWDDAADAAPEQVVVLTEPMNDSLFGGVDSVGKTLRIDDRDFRVVGVMAPWRPSVKFYDVTQGNSAYQDEGIYMPFEMAVPMELGTSGNQDGWGQSPAPGYAGLLAGESTWIQFWVELAPGTRGDYHAFLDAYALEQRKLGRFQRPLDNRVTPLMAWLGEVNLVPKEATAMLVVSLLFLLICSLNLIGLLLGKFLARAAEIGVRRAMGARRLDVFVQHIVECELIALVGGGLGLLLSWAAIYVGNEWARSLVAGPEFVLDWTMAGYAFAAALAAGLVAGLYPAVRVCRIPPAFHLKTQ